MTSDPIRKYYAFLISRGVQPSASRQVIAETAVKLRAFTSVQILDALRLGGVVVTRPSLYRAISEMTEAGVLLHGRPDSGEPITYWISDDRSGPSH